MHVQCPNCGAGGNIPDANIPPDGTQITCPKCKTRFAAQRPESQKMTSQDADASYQEGVNLLKQRQIDAAIEKFNLAIQVDPEHANAYRYLGLAYGQKNLWAEASTVLQKAIQFQPEDVQSLKNLGVAYLKLEQFAEAEQALEQAITHAPQDEKAQSYYAVAVQKHQEEQQQEDEGALQDLASLADDTETATPAAVASDVQPSPKPQHDPLQTLLDKGVECLENAQYNGAIEAFQEVIRIAPQSSHGYFGLGMVYEKRGNWGKVIEAYEKALELNPGDSAAKESVKFARKQQKKFTWKFWKK